MITFIKARNSLSDCRSKKKRTGNWNYRKRLRKVWRGREGLPEPGKGGFEMSNEPPHNAETMVKRKQRRDFGGKRQNADQTLWQFDQKKNTGERRIIKHPTSLGINGKTTDVRCTVKKKLGGENSKGPVEII